jgi:hypothetical protein
MKSRARIISACAAMLLLIIENICENEKDVVHIFGKP